MYGTMMKILSRVLLVGLSLALVACQRDADAMMSNYQAKAEAKLQRLSLLYGAAFGGQARGAREAATTLAFPYGSYTYGSGVSQTTYASASSYNYSGQSYDFNANPVQAMQQVAEILKSLPRTTSTYYFSMVLLARYLSMAMQNQNFLMTWSAQQNSANGLGYQGYNMSYPSFQPYYGQPQQYSQQSQYALQGYQEGE